jgi:hypothetical protein
MECDSLKASKQRNKEKGVGLRKLPPTDHVLLHQHGRKYNTQQCNFVMRVKMVKKWRIFGTGIFGSVGAPKEKRKLEKTRFLDVLIFVCSRTFRAVVQDRNPPR